MDITKIILEAKERAIAETRDIPDPEPVDQVDWPVTCTVGPGLEGAISAETKVGFVNGQKGWLVYRGYNIFDLCAHSNFEEVSYLLLHGALPNPAELAAFNERLIANRSINATLRMLMNFPTEETSAMTTLRLGINLLRQRKNPRLGEDESDGKRIASDEDSIPMETPPRGEKEAIYKFPKVSDNGQRDFESCYQLISGLAVLTAAIARLRQGRLPIEPRDDLSHAANFLYMITGKEPSALETRVMDVALILHADHGMNASTFASMVVASTLSDIYFSIGSGVSALSGPLHGGANEDVVHMLREIGGIDKVADWYKKARAEKRKIPGFGHRVYKAYDPRARILAPLAEALCKEYPEAEQLMACAKELEKAVVAELGVEKKIFPNVDFYSGIVYESLGLSPDIFTAIFAVSRVSGWTARVMEYLQNNRIFRPRAIYTGQFYDEFPTKR